MYWPFTYEVKLTVMKETENCTCKYIATKSKSGTLYVWNNVRCPCRRRLKLNLALLNDHFQFLWSFNVNLNSNLRNIFMIILYFLDLPVEMLKF